MEVKHIIPAYSTTRSGEGEKEKSGKMGSLRMAIRNFTKKFKRRRFDRDDHSEEFSGYRSSRLDSERSSIKNRVADRFGNGTLKFNKSSLIKWGVITIIASVILVGGFRYMNDTPSRSNESSDRVQVKGAKATQAINREFSFPLRDSQGEEISELKYLVESVELRDEILVQGQKATAIQGRIFLIVTLKLSNEYTQAIEMDTRDYVRLSVNGNQDEWMAPDIHNDPVEVQAISTKYTRVGFAINESDENLLLRVGEIRGDKEIIELDL